MAKRMIDILIYDRPITQWNTKKYRLLIKWDCKCIYCGCDLKVSTCQLEHFIARSKQGAGSIKSGNIVPSCLPCNLKKGVKSIEEFRIKFFGKRNPGLFHFEKIASNG